jgi:hypothetical protein
MNTLAGYRVKQVLSTLTAEWYRPLKKLGRLRFCCMDSRYGAALAT